MGSVEKVSINIAGIPKAMKERPQWVCWQFLRKPGIERLDKLPLCANSEDIASSTNPATWSPFRAALDAYKSRKDVHGIGFVFAPDDEFFGIDLDHCIEAGSMASWVKETLERFGTYAEFSPSKTGIHLIGHGRIPQGMRGRKKDNIECYDRGRYFTITGDVVPSFPALADCHATLDAWYFEVFGSVSAARSNGGSWDSIAIRFDPDRQPLELSLGKFAAFLSSSKKVDTTWKNERKDLKDTSCSGHDLSLADFAAQADWTPQEICDLLVAHRKEHKKDLKRLDYYQRTIWQTRHPTQHVNWHADKDPEDVKLWLSERIGAMVEGFYQEGEGEGAIYSIQIGGNTLLLGDSYTIQEQKRWRAVMIAQGLRPMPQMKDAAWCDFLEATLTIRQIHSNTGVSPTAGLEDDLRAYARQGRDYSYWTLLYNHPYSRDGLFYLHVRTFYQWLKRSGISPIATRAELMRRLRALKFHAVTVSAREEDAQVSRTYWTGPLPDPD